MSRNRSPSYPSVSLSQAIDLVSKIHRTCRTNVISRENAAHEMGYSGMTGRSMKVLADLLQFGLLEKAGSGDVKVTQRAVDILHAIDPVERDEAIIEAAYAPQLFRDIHDRFPDGIPSEGVIKSYLIQQDFMDAAIGPAISAFMQTYRTVEHLRSSNAARDSMSASRIDDTEEAIEASNAVSQAQTAAVTAAQLVGSDMQAILTALTKGDLNEIGLSMVGDRVAVAGLLDIKGLRQLKRKIAGMEALLAPDEADDD
jgi:hypothetical protein